MKREIILTADGSHTIYVPEIDEHYHSVNGAIQESEHIFIRGGFKTVSSGTVHIFEAGFGTGLNALLTAMASLEGSQKVFYTSIEKYPLERPEAELLNYGLLTGKTGEEIFRLIHRCDWGSMTEITGNFSIMKVKGDLVNDYLTGNFDLIYYDAFGPGKQPEMWTRDLFAKVAEHTHPGTVLVTYSAKGEVKRILRDLGFRVMLLPGPPGKRHFTRAVKF